MIWSEFVVPNGDAIMMMMMIVCLSSRGRLASVAYTVGEIIYRVELPDMEQITLIYLENNDGDDYCKCVVLLPSPPLLPLMLLSATRPECPFVLFRSE